MTKRTSNAAREDKAETVCASHREITPEQRCRMIAEAAYYLAERRGFSGGDMVEDWRAAEADIDLMLGREEIGVGDGTIESRVRSILENDPAVIADQVCEITLQALSGGGMDKEVISRIAAAVIAGAKEATVGAAKGAVVLKEAMRGLDDALAAAAEATYLALQEAAGRSDEFSRQAIRKALDDLGAMESLFIETLSESAKTASGFTQTTLADLAEHARVGGTAVGRQIEPALKQLASAFADTLHDRAELGAEALREQSARLAGIATGVIKGIVEHLRVADANENLLSKKGHR